MSGGEDRPDIGLQLHRVSALQYAAPRLSSLLSAQRVVSEMYSAVWRGLTASEYNCTGVGMVDYIIIEISFKRLHRLFQHAKYFFFRIADVFSQYSFSLHFY